MTFAVLCAALAALPALDLLYPLYPPIHRTVTHSVGATLLVTIVAMGVTGWVTGRFSWRVPLICGAAYGSHILLDWLAKDPNPPLGIQALWPFSDGWFTSGWNVFRPTERRQLFTSQAVLTNLEALLQELAILGPLLWLATRRRRTRAPISGRGGRP